MEATLDPTNPKRYAIEYRVQRGDGEIRYVEAHGLTYFEGASHERRAISVVGAAQDVTERKEREEKEHLLMRENQPSRQKHAECRGGDRSPDRCQKSRRFHRALLRTHPGAFGESGPPYQ